MNRNNNNDRINGGVGGGRNNNHSISKSTSSESINDVTQSFSLLSVKDPIKKNTTTTTTTTTTSTSTSTSTSTTPSTNTNGGLYSGSTNSYSESPFNKPITSPLFSMGTKSPVLSPINYKFPGNGNAVGGSPKTTTPPSTSNLSSTSNSNNSSPSLFGFSSRNNGRLSSSGLSGSGLSGLKENNNNNSGTNESASKKRTLNPYSDFNNSGFSGSGNGSPYLLTPTSPIQPINTTTTTSSLLNPSPIQPSRLNISSAPYQPLFGKPLNTTTTTTTTTTSTNTQPSLNDLFNTAMATELPREIRERERAMEREREKEKEKQQAKDDDLYNALDNSIGVYLPDPTDPSYELILKMMEEDIIENEDRALAQKYAETYKATLTQDSDHLHHHNYEDEDEEEDYGGGGGRYNENYEYYNGNGNIDLSYEALVQLENVKVGITKEQKESIIETLYFNPISSKKQLKDDHDSRCSICLEDFESNQFIKKLPKCEHYYHSECIDTWLEENKCCPLDRKEI